jgi:hypothetical protein
MAILSVKKEIRPTQDRNGGRIALQSGVDPKHCAENHGENRNNSIALSAESLTKSRM